MAERREAASRACRNSRARSTAEQQQKELSAPPVQADHDAHDVRQKHRAEATVFYQADVHQH
jgi:hypothetical protein